MSIISIGVQSGGPIDGGIGTIKIDLYKELEKRCQSTYCKAIDEYAPVIRVDGALHKFGDEKSLGLDLLKSSATLQQIFKYRKVFGTQSPKMKFGIILLKR